MKQEDSDRLKNWKDRIAVMFLVQEEIQRHDKLGVFQYYYPELAATEEQVNAVEKHLGHCLDKDYRDFLMCANGWKCFNQNVSLFSTGDLEGSSLMDYALEMLETMDMEYPIGYTGFSKEELLPIAATKEDKDLYVITRATSHQPGVVIWFAGEEVERYPNFEEFILAITDYNRANIKWLDEWLKERGYEA